MKKLLLFLHLILNVQCFHEYWQDQDVIHFKASDPLILDTAALLRNGNVVVDMVSNLPPTIDMRASPDFMSTDGKLSSARDINTTEFEVFQLDRLLPDYGAPVLRVELMNHTFANSSAAPFTAVYKAPDVHFNRVVLNLEVISNGFQRDRIGSLFLNGVELWRTNTAEPGGRKIVFGHAKDASRYLNLFLIDGNLAFTMNNMMDQKFNGAHHTRLTALYYLVPESPPPITVRHQQDQSMESSPPTFVTSLLDPSSPVGYWSHPKEDMTVQLAPLPRNTTRVGLELMASGEADDEFWFSTIDSKTTKLLGIQSTRTGSPTRLINVYINDELAGQAIPAPIIRSGGLSPFMWSTVVGANAFDFPHLYIDLTAYLPMFWADVSTLRVTLTDGLADDAPVTYEWLVTASLFTWQLPGVIGDGSMQTRGGINYEDYHNEANEALDNGHVEQAAGFSHQLTRNANLIFTHTQAFKDKSSQIEAMDVVWQQSLLTNNFINVTKDGYPTEIGHFQSQIDVLEVKEVYSGQRYRPVDSIVEIPLNIALERTMTTFDARMVQKSSRWDRQESIIHYVAANSSHDLFSPDKGEALSQQAMIHQPRVSDKSRVYMRHVGAKGAMLIFDGRWLGPEGQSSTVDPPERMAKFIAKLEPIKNFILASVQLVRAP